MLWSPTLLIRGKDFLFGKLARRLEDNIKIELKSLCRQSVDWFRVFQVRDR
jgi:hypothetical protein